MTVRVRSDHDRRPGSYGYQSRNGIDGFGTRFFSEGWPLYWEMRFSDMRFQRLPEKRMGRKIVV
jgi:hypothetical protein